MSETNEKVTPETIELAREAIAYVIGRIRHDENIRYHMGAFTEAFEQLKAAHSAFTGISQEAIEKNVLGGTLRGKAAAERMDEIKKIIDDWQSNELSENAALVKISGMVQRPF